jgi:hypothetical protein
MAEKKESPEERASFKFLEEMKNKKSLYLTKEGFATLSFEEYLGEVRFAFEIGWLRGYNASVEDSSSLIETILKKI